MTTFKRNILITGGAGFIGSHVVRLFVNKYLEYRIINLDKLTYVGNLPNLKDIENNEKSSSWKRPNTIRTAPTLPARRAATILCGPSTIPTACRPS